MNTFVALMILLLGVSAHHSDRFINFVNNNRGNKAITWKSELSSRFDYDNAPSLTAVLGVSMENVKKDNQFNHFTNLNNASIQLTITETETHARLLQTLPASLDLRATNPKCWSIGFIRDQAGCGSCWAVSSMASLSDRYCISKSTPNVLVQRSFSYEDLLECCPNAICGSNGNGCNGGYMNGGYAYAQQVGVSSGENYNNINSCKPYFLQPGYSASNAPACKTSCANASAYKTLYANDKIKIKSYTVLAGKTPTIAATNMMSALSARGSIMVYMDVYEDFYTYSSGVYHYVSGGLLGGHAVRVVGYGTENGVNYWLIANSWGTNWGLAGFFKIQRGVNMVNIEAYPIEAIMA